MSSLRPRTGPEVPGRLRRSDIIPGLYDYLRDQWFEAEVEPLLPRQRPLLALSRLTLRIIVRSSLALAEEEGSESESSGLKDSEYESPGSESPRPESSGSESLVSVEPVCRRQFRRVIRPASSSSEGESSGSESLMSVEPVRRRQFSRVIRPASSSSEGDSSP